MFGHATNVVQGVKWGQQDRLAPQAQKGPQERVGQLVPRAVLVPLARQGAEQE